MHEQPVFASCFDLRDSLEFVNEKKLEILLGVLVVFTAALYLPASYHLNINWDEFRYLSDVYRFEAGTLNRALQTLHVHLFGWLRELGGHEIDQVLAGRTAYFGLLLVSGASLFLIARPFMSAAGGLFAVLCFLSYSDVIAHATSFRFDGLAVAVLLLAGVLVTRRKAPLATAGGAGGLSAVAVLVTMKSIFFLPTVAALLLLRHARGRTDLARREGGHPAIDVIVYGAVFLVAFVLLYSLHAASLAALSVVSPAQIVEPAASRGIQFHTPVPRRFYALRTLFLNFPIWCLVFAGGWISLRRIVQDEGRRNALLVLSFLLPLGSILIYRNAFPYFYVMVVPFTVVLAGVPFDGLVEAARSGARTGRVASLLLVLALGAAYAAHYPRGLRDEIETQREVLRAIHEIFPEPEPYIDRASMVASFPKTGFFMSSWGFQNYHDAGEPIFRDLLLTERPRFVVANHPALILDSTDTIPESPGSHRLLPEDYEVLRENYVSHWGPVYVAGKELSAPTSAPYTFEILVPGPYTVEATDEVIVSGTVLQPGDVVSLDQGDHTLDHATGDVTLRWGDHLPPPRRASPDGILFYPFTWSR